MCFTHEKRIRIPSNCSAPNERRTQGFVCSQRSSASMETNSVFEIVISKRCEHNLRYPSMSNRKIISFLFYFSSFMAPYKIESFSASTYLTLLLPRTECVEKSLGVQHSKQEKPFIGLTRQYSVAKNNKCLKIIMKEHIPDYQSSLVERKNRRVSYLFHNRKKKPVVRHLIMDKAYVLMALST